MGLRDHRRQWKYELTAEPSDCLKAFQQSFQGRRGLVNSKWRVRQSASSATATYEGRAGAVAGIARILSSDAAQEEEQAIGSEVAFEVSRSANGRTECVMWLRSEGRSGIAGLMGATSDGRFIRPYMQSVTANLTQLDPSIRVSKV